MALSCLRFQQAQLAELREGAVFCGCQEAMTLRDKHPNPTKQQARPFWIPSEGLVVNSGWLHVLQRSLSGVENGCFLWRDNNSRSGDPFEATGWKNEPCSSARALTALRTLLRRVCGLSGEQAQTFGLSSARHFLPEIALARNLSPEDRVEIGRWSGSTAQDADLTPARRQEAAASRSRCTLPDRYAPKANVVRVCKILTQQVDAAREVVSQNPTLTGGWELLRPEAR
jgi:hypothetical protein